MQLERGVRLGSYEVGARIGAGGMGEVYRARDLKLDREVAIKVLPELFAADPDRLSRFEREARTLALLNHPNIAQVYGVLEEPPALVMELVSGEDLAERLKRGAIPLDDAIPIARQIAEALEVAHERGIIHRDLKPGNVKLREDGTVKVLDFGLAKLHGGDDAPRYQSEAAAIATLDSPTFASPAMTQAGVILGTAAYMAPEQARGGLVDRRADIWAFGAVLFEMLSGRPLFDGATTTDTLAAVLKTDPEWRALPAGTPTSIERLLRRCLERDVKQRLQAIGEARIVLSGRVEAEAPAGIHRGSSRPSHFHLLPWAVAAAAVAALAWTLIARGDSSPSARQTAHLDLSFPAEIEPVPALESGFNISPDGRMAVISGVRAGSRRLHVRHLSSEAAVEVTDSAGVTGSTFSPDGRSIAFVSNTGLIMKVVLADQQRSVLARGGDLAGGIAWGEAGVVFARNGALWLVPDGGTERQLTTLDPARKEGLHSNAMPLPGGKMVLFTSMAAEPGSERIEAVSVAGGPRTVVLERASSPVWSPTGHLLFARDGALLATAFDPISGKASGSATTVMAKGSIGSTTAGGLGIRMSSSGDLLFLPDKYQTKRLELVTRDGASLGLPVPPARYMNPRASSDGRRVIIEVAGTRIDAFDRERQTMSRLTTDTPGVSFVIWGRDGRYAIFRRFNTPFWLATDGSGRQGSIPAGVSNDYPSGAGPDADSFLSTRIGPTTAGDVVLVSRTSQEVKPLIVTPAYEGGARLSPDGRWLVYVSTESGQSEIYVRRYPSLERSWQVSGGVGVQPQWRHDGREIFFRDGQSMIGVPFEGSGAEPVIGKPVALFKDDYDLGQGVTIPNYDVTGDGRFLMLRRDSKGVALRIVLNWTDELKRLIEQGGVR